MDWFVNSTISAEMAENPSVMTAAGWRQDPKTGKMQQKKTASTNKLAENLGVISMLADGPQGVIAPLKLGWKVLRHPVQTAKEVAQAEKRKEKLVKQLKETKEYDEKIAHLALSRIDIDLDDGVKVNYEKVQTGQDGKKLDILGKIQGVMKWKRKLYYKELHYCLIRNLSS